MRIFYIYTHLTNTNILLKQNTNVFLITKTFLILNFNFKKYFF